MERDVQLQRTQIANELGNWYLILTFTYVDGPDVGKEIKLKKKFNAV